MKTLIVSEKITLVEYHPGFFKAPHFESFTSFAYLEIHIPFRRLSTCENL